MSPQETEKRRKYFFIGISLLATAITLAIFGATYAINKRSFADWGSFGSVYQACRIAVSSFCCLTILILK